MRGGASVTRRSMECPTEGCSLLERGPFASEQAMNTNNPFHRTVQTDSRERENLTLLSFCGIEGKARTEKGENEWLLFNN